MVCMVTPLPVAAVPGFLKQAILWHSLKLQHMYPSATNCQCPLTAHCKRPKPTNVTNSHVTRGLPVTLHIASGIFLDLGYPSASPAGHHNSLHFSTIDIRLTVCLRAGPGGPGQTRSLSAAITLHVNPTYLCCARVINTIGAHTLRYCLCSRGNFFLLGNSLGHSRCILSTNPPPGPRVNPDHAHDTIVHDTSILALS
jgi:hypothetical protein